MDQVGHKKAIEGLKTTEQIEGLFGSCLLIIGTSFHSKNEVGIYGSSDKDGPMYFIFGDPYNEDEVIEFLKLYQSSEEQEAHPDVDEQILNELIASYDSFKEKELGMEEELEDEEKKGEIKEEEEKEVEQDPSSLWIQFREVTGFVPLSCWKIIETDQEIDETLEERLDRINNKIVSKVCSDTYSFFLEISELPRSAQLKTFFQSFCKHSRNNYLQNLQQSLIPLENSTHLMRFGNIDGDNRISWDLRYVSCSYDNKEHRMSTPIALSGSIAAGLHMVFLRVFLTS